ncbi:MAG: flagellar protein FlaG [Dechloromonas sp.]|nr:flagellar protein FlaG [Dechloromonas sp.]
MDIQTNSALPPVSPSVQPAALAVSRDNKAVLSTNTDNRPTLDQKKSEAPSRQDIEQATEQVKKFISPTNSDIRFSIDEDTGITVVKVMDKTTNEIIRQIPGDEILQIAKALDRLQGLLVKQQA